MDAMRNAISKRRAKLAGDIDFDDMKNANINPDEGSNDDLNIENIISEENDTSGLAPEISAASRDGDSEMIFQETQETPDVAMGTGNDQVEDEEKRISSFFSKDDVGKPGIKGKAAAKMAEALKKFKKS